MIDWYDRDGAPINAARFEEIQKSMPDYKRVGGTVISSRTDPSIRLWVSTVWLGLDHSLYPGSKPVIFETMVFEHGSQGIERDTRRYHTEAEALAGHQEMVKETMQRVPDAITSEHTSGEGFLMDPQQRHERLSQMAQEAKELMASLESDPEPEGLQ